MVEHTDCYDFLYYWSRLGLIYLMGQTRYICELDERAPG